MSNLTPKPKVVAAVLGGIIASAVLSNVTLITPDLFDGLGKWSGLVYGLTITIVMGICGWLKSEGTVGTGDATQETADALAQAKADATRAPATFPSAAVEAAQAAEPAPVTPVYTPPTV